MTRVLVVDDDPMVRRLLRTILQTHDIEVVAEAGDGDEAVTAVQAHHPDVVLMDLRMRRLSGIDATVQIGRLPRPPAVLAMTSFDTDAVVMDAVRAGASGFLAKDSGPEEIVAAVLAVAEGDGALSPRAARVVMTQAAQDAAAEDRHEARRLMATLTDRERQFSLAVAQGLSNVEIARRHYVAEATVKTHLGRAMAKLGVANRVQLAVIADRGVREPR